MLNHSPLRLSVDQDAMHHAAESDVLRFIGTLALCLMLLFAVDQSFNQTPAPPPPKTDAPVVLGAQPPPMTAVVPPVAAPTGPVLGSIPGQTLLLHDVERIEPPVQLPPADENPEPPAANALGGKADGGGPALYFASDVAFLSLLTQRRIEVYLRRGSVWSRVTLERDTETPVPPSAVYRLRQDTVPELLRRRIKPTDPNQTVEWGVRLSQELDTAVQALLAQANGVDVVIEGSGKARTQARDPHPTGAEDSERGAHDGGNSEFGQRSIPGGQIPSEVEP